MHWASECPHKDEQDIKMNPEIILKLDSVMLEDEHLTLLSSKTNNLALIDSGASKTVCGKRWFDTYESSLDVNDRKKIKEEESMCQFRFGDGVVTKSNIVKIIPTTICGKDVAIKANVVDNDIPMLISRKTLGEAKAQLNFEKDTIEMAGVSQKLINTSSGHLAVPLVPH